MLNDTAAPKEFVLVDGDKAEFAQELTEFCFLRALCGIEGVVRVLRVAHKTVIIYNSIINL